jgi:hypothetical protein
MEKETRDERDQRDQRDQRPIYRSSDLFTSPALTCREAAGWEVYALLVGNSRVNHWPRGITASNLNMPLVLQPVMRHELILTPGSG